MGKNYKLNEEGIKRIAAASPRFAAGNSVELWAALVEDGVTDGKVSPDNCVLTIAAAYTKSNRKIVIDLSGCFYVASISIGRGVAGGVRLRLLPKKRVPKPKPLVFSVTRIINQ